MLLLDEPFSALDSQTRLIICNDVYKIVRKEKKSVILVTHSIEEAITFADKIIVLDDGEMAGIGTHEELLANCDVYKEIYYSQYPEERLKAAKASGNRKGGEHNGW